MWYVVSISLLGVGKAFWWLVLRLNMRTNRGEPSARSSADKSISVGHVTAPLEGDWL